tara:strand:- start:1351 stop:2694 length:1344 start_codon:yes stop_codon:yes gene_type:complete
MKKNFTTKPGEVLKGSTLLRKNSESLGRVNHLLKYMNENKAFLFNKQNHKDSNKFLEKLKKDYFVYRDNWDKQPQNAIKNGYLSDELKKNDIIPLCLDIEIASVCDLACPFCFREFVATPDKIIDEKLCYDLIDQAADLQIPSIKFNWRGEPLLHPKLPDFVKYAKKKGILETIINTNATQLTEKLAEKLINSGLDLIIYSFDGGSKKTYEKMRPGRFKKNTFEKVYENIKNLKKIKEKLSSNLPYTKIQMILTKETSKEVDSFFDYFSDYVDDVTTTPYTERGGEISDLNDKERETYSEILKKNNLPEGTHYIKDIFGNIQVSKGRIPCEQPYQRLLVTYEGKVAMCCYDWGAKHPVGFVDKKSFNNQKDYLSVMEQVKKKKKGFELLENIKMPEVMNEPKKEIKNIKEIWFGREIDGIRKKHICNEADDVKICSKCTFKDVFKWV